MSDSVSEDEILVLDLIGFFCPIPIHETRKLLDKSKPGTIVKVVCLTIVPDLLASSNLRVSCIGMGQKNPTKSNIKVSSSEI